MTEPIRLVLALHNHQPIGNFDGVFEQAYQDSYLPFLNVLQGYPSLPISLHVSGCLLEWLDARHGEYVDRLAALVAAGQVEILGGAFYEAILPMIPPRDRLGQIRKYSAWLKARLGANVRGMWIPERVWEPSLVSDLAAAGIQYTVLDDFHFKCAGLNADQLHGYYLSEDNGHLVSIFPGSERLRYLIPFASPQATVDYLREVGQKSPGAVVVFGDDGEKFGTWPETKRHVYDNGWLVQFFEALLSQADWLKVTTLAEAIDHVPPAGKIYLPDASYREMTEWVLPVQRLHQYENLKHELQHDARWGDLSQFMRGGFWRNYKVKYPEADEMYCRMLMVSDRVEQAATGGADTELVDLARDHLYKAQCNCSYWHGAFGGIYLPHLRNAVYHHLILADNALLAASRRDETWIEATVGDYNLDARQEVFLANDKVALLVAPARGGLLYELDVRSIGVNLLATLARRPEAYHRKILARSQAGLGEVASIHDRVIFKQAGLDQRVQYDTHPRKSLLDHFYDATVELADVIGGAAAERGDFLAGVYHARVRRSAGKVQVQLARQGSAGGHLLKLTKAVTLEAGSPVLTLTYLLEDLPQETLHFAPEFNFAALPSGLDDRYFRDADHVRLGHLGSRLDLSDVYELGLVDEWLGIDAALSVSRPTHIWTYPVETVSQSEGGFELVHQSVVVQPHWLVEPDVNGRWGVSIRIEIDTSLAESRRRMSTTAAAVS